ncbi:MAG TPA: hypothetical protein VFW24_03040 [Acidimicrobiales bacterium]|nr:hypothetical protein [Acidimicrobiales bacterium]
MTKQRATFGKLQRERDKQAKARAKRERRQAAAEQTEEEAVQDAGQPVAESAPVLIDLIADLHRRFENAEISLETYEERKAELLSRLPID